METHDLEGWICAGVSPERWRRQVEVSRDLPGVWHGFGVHPWAIRGEEARDNLPEWLHVLAQALEGTLGVSPVGIGETGLHRIKGGEPADLALQEQSLLAHLELANTYQLPLIFHCVNAHGRLLDILGSEGVPFGGMVHSFSGSVEVMKRYVSLGLMVSFSGLITRPAARRAREAVASIPEDHLLIETDAPDQRPVGVGEEESPFTWLPRILSEVSSLRKTPSRHVREITTENARKLFRLDRETPSGG